MKRLATLLVSLALCSLAAYGANLHINCRPGDPAGKISKLLKTLDPSGPNTITIGGTCTDNVFIYGIDRLTLIAESGAGITDASGGQNWGVVVVMNSRNVSMYGFTITGGNTGVACYDASVCRFGGNTIQNALQRGVDINDSQATFQGDTLQDSQGVGLYTEGSNIEAQNLTIQRNAGGGVFATAGKFVGVQLSVHDNTGDGIFGNSNLHLQLIDSQVFGNTFNGIDVVAMSDVSLENDTVSNNGYGGVRLSDLAYGWFDGGSYFANGQPDIGCWGRYTIANNLQAVAVGSTNCNPPVAAAATSK